MSATDQLGGQFSAMRASGEIDDGSPCVENDPRPKCKNAPTQHAHGHANKDEE